MQNWRYFVFFLAPLAYSKDGDPFRAFEVVLIAGLFSLLFLRPRMVRFSAFEPTVLTIYALFLLVQQLLIDNGNLFFGLKFAVATTAAFLPFWVLRSSHWYQFDIMTPVRHAIFVLLIISAFNFIPSFFLGIGERYQGGIIGYRAFGFLGDSFTPVLVFLILFYFFERRWLFSALALLLLVMTGGKAGLMIMAAALLLYAVFVTKSAVVRLVSILLIGVFLLLPIGLSDAVANLQNFEYSLNNRLFSFQIGWEYFRENPVFGIGINQGLSTVEYDVETLARSSGISEYYGSSLFHNSYIQSLAETGFIGFALLLLLVTFWVRGGLKAVACARNLPHCCERSFLAASGVWVVCFVLGYQTTGWFLNGHPQLAWLLVLSTHTAIIRERVLAIAKSGQTDPAPKPALNPFVPVQSLAIH